MKDFFSKLEASFKAALRGEENVNAIIYWWGVIGYAVAFIVNKIITSLHIYAFGFVVSAVMVSYFIWHIYVLRKCAPKKPKLTKEEKAKLRSERLKEMPRKVMRKILLQESITKYDPVFVTMVIDAFCVAQFLGHILR